MTNDESLSDYDKRVVALMDILIKTETAGSRHSRDLFNLYNERFKPRETGVHCPGCRARVFKKMKEYYNQIKNKTT